MTRSTLAVILIASVLVAPAVISNDLVEIRVRGVFFAEPANIQVIVAVEPAPDNRRLRIEADGDRMFRSSELELEGDGEKRLHTIQFKNLAAGAYTLRAEVLSAGNDVIAIAEKELIVSGRTE